MLQPLRRLLPVTAVLLSLSAAAAEDLDQRLERVFGDKKELEEKPFGPARWLGEGARYTTLEPSPLAKEVKDPKEAKEVKDIASYDAESGKREVLVSAAQLTPPGEGQKPLAITDYSWSKDGRWLLVFTNAQKVWRQKTRGDYWLLDRSSGQLRKLGGAAAPATLMFAKLSPDASRVAYVRERNLYSEEVATGAITQLTSDGSEAVFNGIGDWVSEEELGIRDAFRWSDDGRYLAYWQFDTTGVRDFLLLNDTEGLYPVLTRYPYPKVGTQNSAVKVGVVEAAGGKTRWLDLPGDPRQRYLARIAWVKDAPQLVVHQLNRLQNHLEVLLADAGTGAVSKLFEDSDKAWVSVREEPLWSHDGRTLLIVSERDGWQHAYAVSRADHSVRLLTPQPADVIGLVGTDAKDEFVYYLAAPEDPTRRYLYRARLDGKGKAERLTPAGQPGTHRYTVSPDGRYAFHIHSTFDQPPVTLLVRLPSHQVVRTLEDNAGLRSKLGGLLRPPEFFQVEAGSGVKLDGWMLRPAGFDPRLKYPVVVFVYGEPAGVTVTDAWGAGRNLFHQALADAGYVVLSLDNRGTPAPKGRDWRKVIYGEVNVLAVAEQTAALKRLLAERPYLDGARVGVWGHSGGGSNTLNLMFRSPDLFRVGVSSAPVADQKYYDTIYQERYMGLPEQNAAGYKNGSPITWAEGLKGKLLLIHGAADDNVHYQGTELLINRLVELQKPFELMVYPNGSHALAEGKGYSLHHYRLTARYFLEHLPAGGRPQEQ